MSDIDTILRQIKPRVLSWMKEGIAASASGSAGISDHGLLSGLSDDDHAQYVHTTSARSIVAQHTFAPSSPAAPFVLGANAQNQLVTGLYADQLNKSVTAGNGLTGGGVLTASVTLNVGAGSLITVSADAVGVSNGTVQYQVPLTGATPFAPAWSTTSADPGAAIAVLRTDASGYLSLVRLRADTITDKSGSGLTIMPTGDITLDPTGDDILPFTNYDLNIGSINRKFLTLWAAELWVETLVAQNTIATIGGRILVAPTTELTSDVSSTLNQIVQNYSFETDGAGGADVFADWSEYAGNGSITKDTVVYYSGLASAKLTCGADLTCYMQQNITVTEGHGLLFRFMSRGDGTNAGYYAVYDVTHSVYIQAKTTTGQTATSWAQTTYTFVVPTGCTTVRIYLWAPNVSTGYANFDYVRMYDDTIEVKHNEMVVDDIVYLAAAPSGVAQVEFMRILSAPLGTGPYTYSVWRNVDATGANNWYAGDAVLNTGQIGDGYIDLYSLNSIRSGSHWGPTITGNVRNSLTYNDISEVWAIGNLNGIYGFVADRYGVGLGKYANGESFMVIEPVAGIRMRYRAADVNHTIGQWDINGDFILGEVATDLPNMFWDCSAGKLSFRGGTNGTVEQAYIDSTGAIMAGAGAVTLNSSGISITTGNLDPNAIKWVYGGVNRTELFSDYTSATGANTFGLNCNSTSNGQAYIDIETYAPGTGAGRIDLINVCGTGTFNAQFYCSRTEAYLDLNGTTQSGTTAASLRVAGGVGVGNYGTAYANGDVSVENNIYSGGTIRGRLALRWNAALTISSGGAITVPSGVSYAQVDEYGAAADNLDTINGGSLSGELLLIRVYDTDYAITVRDNSQSGTGNIYLAGSANFAMGTNTQSTLVLMYDGTNWIEVCRSVN